MRANFDAIDKVATHVGFHDRIDHLHDFNRDRVGKSCGATGIVSGGRAIAAFNL